MSIFVNFFDSIWSLFQIRLPIVNMTFAEISISTFIIYKLIDIIKNFFDTKND